MIEILSTRDITVQLIERVTFTHKVGRLVPGSDYSPNSPVLVFAAHADDDILGVGIRMRRHVQSGEHVGVIFTTNGGEHNRSRRLILRTAQLRYREACSALAHIGIPQDNVFCLGFPDGRLYRYMVDMALDIKSIIEKNRPEQIYVHAIEGGHRDHDVTGFVVQSVCRQLGYSEVYEWAEYNPFCPLGGSKLDFPPEPEGVLYEPMRIRTTPEEHALKRIMLLTHSSQVEGLGFTHYTTRDELIRRANLNNLQLKLLHFWTYSIDSSRLLRALQQFQLFMEKEF